MKNISSNFGVIKDTVYKFSGKQLVAEGNKHISVLNAFLKEIKENPLFKLQYLIYKNLENGHSIKKSHLAERYINQNLALITGKRWHDIITENKALRTKILSDCHVGANSEYQENLYEAIHTLIKSVTSPNFIEVDQSQEAFDVVCEHLMVVHTPDNAVDATLTEVTDHPKFFSWNYVTDLAVNKFNERYAHLNEGERSLLKVLLSPEDNKRNYLLDLKKESMDIINGILFEGADDTTKTALEKFNNKILAIDESKISKSDIDEAIINLEELKYNLTEVDKIS